MNYDPDPPRRWKRKNYDESFLPQLTVRKRSEIETDRDLAKPPEQLVCDVHEETHGAGNVMENLAGAQKRMVSLMARVAKSNDRASFWMIVLTLVIAIMTLVLLLFTYWSWQDTRAMRANVEKASSITSAPISPTPGSVSSATPTQPNARQSLSPQQ